MSQPNPDDLQLEQALGSASNPSNSSKPHISKKGVVLLAATGTTAVIFTAVTAPFLLPGLRRICLPFVPAGDGQVRNVMALLKEVPEVSSGRVLDIGSGDGRLVIEAAKLGYKADGVELNPWLVAYSRYQARKQGVSKNTRFYRRNLWKHDLSQYSGVIVFGVDSMMEPLREKIVKEMSVKNNRGVVIACRFPLIGYPVTAEVGEGLDTVWLYRVKDLLEYQQEQKEPQIKRYKQ